MAFVYNYFCTLNLVEISIFIIRRPLLPCKRLSPCHLVEGSFNVSVQLRELILISALTSATIEKQDAYELD